MSSPHRVVDERECLLLFDHDRIARRLQAVVAGGGARYIDEVACFIVSSFEVHGEEVADIYFFHKPACRVGIAFASPRINGYHGNGHTLVFGSDAVECFFEIHLWVVMSFCVVIVAAVYLERTQISSVEYLHAKFGGHHKADSFAAGRIGFHGDAVGQGVDSVAGAHSGHVERGWYLLGGNIIRDHIIPCVVLSHFIDSGVVVSLMIVADQKHYREQRVAVEYLVERV